MAVTQLPSLFSIMEGARWLHLGIIKVLVFGS